MVFSTNPMKFVRATPNNVQYFVGFQCVYNHGRGVNKTRHIAKILGASASGKSIKINEAGGDWSTLQTVTREIWIITPLPSYFGRV